VRDLWVQEFLKELIVDVAALSDLAGSIIVEILHCGEGFHRGRRASSSNLKTNLSCL